MGPRDKPEDDKGGLKGFGGGEGCVEAAVGFEVEEGCAVEAVEAANGDDGAFDGDQADQ